MKKCPFVKLLLCMWGRVELIFEKIGPFRVVPNWYRTPIPKFHFDMLILSLVQGL